jgi:hypothetical protein
MEGLYCYIIIMKRKVVPKWWRRTGGSFTGVKLQGREANLSPPAGAKVKKTSIYTFTPPYVFLA